MSLFQQVLGSFSRTKSVFSILAKGGASGPKSSISLLQLTAYGFCAVVGSGIFVNSGTGGRTAGPSVILSFVMAMIFALFNAFCFAELGTAVPSAGSGHSYSYVALGEWAGMLCGLMILLHYIVSTAAIAKGCAGYFVSIASDALSPLGLHVDAIGSLDANPMAIILVILSILLTSIGANKSTAVQFFLVCFNIATILFFIFYGVQYVDSANYSPFFPTGFDGTLKAASSLFFSYLGFEAITMMSENAKKPSHVFLAMVIVFAVVTCLYVGIAVVMVGSMPWYLLDITTPMVTAFEFNGAPKAVSTLISVSAFLVTLMCLSSCIACVPRVMRSVAEAKLLPASWIPGIRGSDINIWCLLITSILVAILGGFVSLGELLSAATVAAISQYTFTVLSVITLSDKYRRVITPAEAKEELAIADAISAHQEREDIANAAAVALNNVAATAPNATAAAESPAAGKVSASVSEVASTASLTDNPSVRTSILQASAQILDQETLLARAREGLLSSHYAAPWWLVTTTFLCFFVPCFFYAFKDWFGKTAGIVVTVVVYVICAATVIYSLWGSQPLLPANRFRAPLYPVFPVIALGINGVMMSSFSFVSVIICVAVAVAGVALFSFAKWVGIKRGEDFVGWPALIRAIKARYGLGEAADAEAGVAKAVEAESQPSVVRAE